jgi:hypothetical protein
MNARLKWDVIQAVQRRQRARRAQDTKEKLRAALAVKLRREGLRLERAK